ncbi:MAG: hypothetical protein OEP52_11915 [Acidimicrobiia bacterium]|nr:hypothetical protein [Acidimicrobiia bacterium]
MVEVFASLVVVWHSRDLLVLKETHRTRRSLKLIAVSFFARGAVLGVGAGMRLVEGNVPDEPPSSC